MMDIIDGGYTARTHEYSQEVLQVVPPLRTTDKSSTSQVTVVEVYCRSGMRVHVDGDERDGGAVRVARDRQAYGRRRVETSSRLEWSFGLRAKVRIDIDRDELC